MAHTKTIPATILNKAKTLSSSANFVNSVKRENRAQAMSYYCMLIVCVIVVFIISYSIFSTYVTIRSVTNQWWLAATVIPLEYMIIAAILTGFVIKYNSTWWNTKRIATGILCAGIASILPLVLYSNIKDQWVYFPSKSYTQARLVTWLQQDNADIGTIASASAIQGTSDYLVLVTNAKGQSQYIMPQPPFVPKGGEHLWLKYSYTAADSTPRITTMGLLN
jgi:hypothetical protein